VSVLTDEISQDPITAVELACDWGIRHLEIRELFGKRVPDDDPAARRTLLELLESYEVNVAAITPGLFKVPLSDKKAIDQHFSLRLPRSIEFAKSVGTNIIITFTPIAEGPHDERAIEGFEGLLGRSVDIAEREHITLALENEPICFAATGSATLKFARTVNREGLRVNWDPCNAYFVGEDIIDGYRCVRPLVSHVHLKDCVTDKRTGAKRYVAIGSGELGLAQQLKLLKEDGYGGYVTIETHFGPRVKGTKECFEGLKRLLASIGEGVQ